MRVLVVSPCFPPDASPGTHRVLRFVRHFHGLGWPVHVLTIDPGSYKASVPVDQALLSQVPDGIRVRRTGVFRGIDTLIRLRNGVKPSGPASEPQAPKPSGNGPRAPRRAGVWQGFKDVVTDAFAIPDDESGWFWSAVPAGVSLVRREHIEVILSSAPPFTAHVVASAIAGRTGVPWVADFRDPWCRTAWARRGFERPWLRAIHERLERRTVARAKAVVLNTAQMRAEFAQHYGPPLSEKFHTIPNGYDADRLAPYLALRPPGDAPFTIVHAGSLYNERDPRPVLQALSALVREGAIPAARIRLELIGTVSPNFQVPSEVERLGLEPTIRLAGKVPHDESLRRLAMAHVLLVIQPRTDLQVPAKLFEYMGLRRPVLALAGPGAVADLVRQGNLGLVVAPDDQAGIRQALATLYGERERLSQIYAPDAAFVRQFDGAVTAERLAELLNDMHTTHASKEVTT